jgi:hypothetical protein
VTIAIRPSWRAGTGGVVGLIWGRREEVYFCRQGWTGQIALIGLKKFVSSRIALPDHIPGNRSAPKRLFEAWRRAFDANDYAAMRDAKRVIDAAAAGEEGDAFGSVGALIARPPTRRRRVGP